MLHKHNKGRGQQMHAQAWHNMESSYSNGIITLYAVLAASVLDRQKASHPVQCETVSTRVQWRWQGRPDLKSLSQLPQKPAGAFLMPVPSFRFQRCRQSWWLDGVTVMLLYVTVNKLTNQGCKADGGRASKIVWLTVPQNTTYRGNLRSDIPGFWLPECMLQLPAFLPCEQTEAG